MALSPRPFRSHLLAWYASHARQLPWRETCDPYRVWLSEIMLQQTRVAAVLDHYREFLRRFPTVQKLAAAREASVLSAWSGLGYYRRARMLYRAAKLIVKERKGNFPTTAAEWRQLPGVGRYTAAAIASIAFGEPVAVVDGNVERVLQRISGHRLAGEELWTSAEKLLDPTRPGDFNQAMMELGATVCTPRAPVCLTCPVMHLCAARGELPGSVKPPRQKNRDIHYALDSRDGEVLLVQRPHNARLMPGMWELPEIAHSTNHAKPAFTLKHSITVTDYTVHVWRISAVAPPFSRSLPEGGHAGKWIPLTKLPKLPLTGLARKILRQAGIIATGTRT